MRRTIKILSLAGTLLGLVFSFPVQAQIKVKEIGLNTGGEARGIAVQDYTIYVANGAKGLSIYNTSNPYVFIRLGVLPFQGSYVDQVAVDGETVVLADTKNKDIFFVNAWDTMKPQLSGTLKAQGDKPRSISVNSGMAFVVEYGDSPADPGYFSGIEVFSFDPNIKSIQLTKLRGVSDVIATQEQLFVGGANYLYVYKRTKSGFNTTPVGKLILPTGEDLSSLALLGEFLFAFGKTNLYAVNVKKPSSPKLLDQESIPGDPEKRTVDAALLEDSAGKTSEPRVYILLTSLKSYGLYIFNMLTGDLSAFSMYDIKTSSWITMRDVDKASQGKVKIHDSKFSRYFPPGAFEGGTIAFGALGSYGVGYVQVRF